MKAPSAIAPGKHTWSARAVTHEATLTATLVGLTPCGAPMQPADSPTSISFADLGLNEAVVQALKDVGYESPTPIQAATIPVLLRGEDLLGQAQTGTGKTEEVALTMLSRLDL